MNHADYTLAVDFQQIGGNDTEAGRVLSLDELMKLFRTCQHDKTPAGVRDAAMLAVLYGCRVRRADLVALYVDDYADGVPSIHGKVIEMPKKKTAPQKKRTKAAPKKIR